MTQLSIETLLTTDAQLRAWGAMQKVILAEYTQDYASLTVHNFYHAGGGVWRAWVKTVKTWGATAHVPVQVKMYEKQVKTTYVSQRPHEGQINISVECLIDTPTKKRVLSHAIQAIQDFTGGSNYTMNARIHKLVYRSYNRSWRVYVERDYYLVEGGDVNKFPCSQYLGSNIDCIVNAERGLLMFATGSYRSKGSI